MAERRGEERFIEMSWRRGSHGCSNWEFWKVARAARRPQDESESKVSTFRRRMIFHQFGAVSEQDKGGYGDDAGALCTNEVESCSAGLCIVLQQQQQQQQQSVQKDFASMFSRSITTEKVKVYSAALVIDRPWNRPEMGLFLSEPRA
ncbi:hypothetical protein MPTK1_5g13930 [Marchantia polymorpha subsp. ruderalis]|nr:hypothetical protein MARPO_0032s0083 [Marchantia polymorpha]PTQ41896.1 hypothetical protein MARPO_0032s0083 [Marchantia polymorpha]BBN11681.1 hypothetical protein Mp_5g13930 [Marchantia polymorpha subsp. ruderalis]BBN11682.1 hypothetical protein Mp_5g13930 [Marchantia polymorpha subsp. ruderalis]|eukprot:PTQ41895.1 hypothetical protein MARPO_0032s0083 [Marchantia polymorpha]